MENEAQGPISFATASDLADFLDTNCHDWNLRMRDRDLLSELEGAVFANELAPLIQAERVALSVWFKDCTAQREYSFTNIDSQTSGSPLPHELVQLPFDYYSQRQAQSPNLYLRARYGLLLWNAPKPYKHIRHAQAALDDLLTALATADCSGRDDRRDCTELIQQACALADAVHHRAADIAAALLDRYTGLIPFERVGRTALLRIITEYPKLFKGADQESLLANTRDLYTECFTQEDFFTCETICKLAAPYAQSLGRDPREWHQRLGQAYEGEAASRRPNDDSSLMAIEFYSRAAKAYQLAGNAVAEAAALQHIQALKPKLKLNTITTEFTPEQVKALLDDVKLQTDLLLKHSPDQILDFLACSERVIPNYTDIKAQAAKEKPSFLSAISTIYIDGNKNTSHGEAKEKSKVEKGKPKESVAEREKREQAERRAQEISQRARQSYSLALSFRLQYLMPAFIEGYRTSKITYETLCHYLESHSWTAQTLSEYDISGNIVEYTWQPMLRPGLQEFFRQLHTFIQEGPAAASFVLCIDSLTLKIEGLLREVLQQMGAHTIATHKRHDLREVFFDDLLDLAQEKELLNENERYFLRYVFTPLGQNLRNDIAHSYYHLPERYSIQTIILLLVSLLRISGFRLRAENKHDATE